MHALVKPVRLRASHAELGPTCMAVPAQQQRPSGCLAGDTWQTGYAAWVECITRMQTHTQIHVEKGQSIAAAVMRK